tara:strand:- start:3668 stop:7075 length:3408 start_codon:yes stop_codon:yes gene_type:complete
VQLVKDKLLFSPSDLITFMESPFASHMERWCLVEKQIKSLMDEADPLLKSLQSRGYAHEDEFLDSLVAGGRDVVKLERASPEVMIGDTSANLEIGVDVIAQAYLEIGQFGGFSDFLIKVPGASRLGDFHYEVWDTKLAKKMKPYFAVQLSCYAEMLECLQGVKPNEVAVVLGSGEIKRLRLMDYYHYYQSLKASFLEFHENWSADTLPDPADSKAHGRWSQYAANLLLDRRHLSNVANISRSQIKRLEAAGVATIDDLAHLDVAHIPKFNVDMLARLKAQAAIQVASEGKERPEYEVREHAPDQALGLALLPPASKNDVFFDLEGYPLVDGGLEYLWGACYFDGAGNRCFRDFWAHDHVQEQQAFTDFVDWVYRLWREDPSMHIYHYAAYEVTVLRRLMGRYGVREFEVDQLLRHDVFVDLYNVVRHGVLIGEPSYSIKNVEHIYRAKRDTAVASGGDSVVVYEEWLANPDGTTWQDSEILRSIRDYNVDDCESTQELAAWLRARQAENEIGYRAGSDVEAVEEEEETDATRLRDRLLARSEAEADDEKTAVFRNLAWLVEFHRRENKPMWWRLFDRRGLTELDLFDDMDCLVGAQRNDVAPYLPTAKSRNKVYEYNFDTNQPYKGVAKSFYVLGEEDVRAKYISYDPDEGFIALQSKHALPNRISLLPDEYVNPTVIVDAIRNVAEQLLETDLERSAITDFLFRRSPHFIDGTRSPIIPADADGDDFTNAVVAAANALDQSYLCIQGPPGSGKTYTARHIILDLLRQGKRVGITSNSHKAITNLMAGVVDALEKVPGYTKLIKVGGDDGDEIFDNINVEYRKGAQACLGELDDGPLCVGGTAWFFCHETLAPSDEFEPLDYLFVDEAGQVSIANLVGMSRATKNIILMGDQMQLGQPIQGSHPDDSGRSILEYLLADEATIPPDLGVFLPKSFRMHPAVCELISEQVYDDRLKSAIVTERHVVNVPDDILPSGSGVHFLPVDHEGNTQGSEEEVAVIKDLVGKLLGREYWPEQHGGKNRKIGLNDILIVAPYNYQVNLLKAALGKDARIGSVDKFQGQEAPIVIVSMCASDASESPRGIDFLFSKNRLNVAISRAQALAIVVGSPTLAQTTTANIEQMALVNFFSAVTRLNVMR